MYTRFSNLIKLTILLVACLVLSGCIATKKQYTGEVLPLDSITELMQVTISESNEMNPVISHDGKRILFESDKAGNIDIFVSEIDRIVPMHVTIDSASDSNPSWSPDDKSIYFDSDRLGYRAIFKKEFSEERVTRSIVTRGTNDLTPDISSSGKTLAFSNCASSGGSIWLLSLQEGAFKQIAEGASPKWSPDGKLLLFTSNKTGNSDIWLIDDEANTLTQITVDSADDITPKWSPDGKSIVFASNRTGNFDIWLLHIEKNELVQLTNNPAEDSHPVFTPDGKHIYFQSDRNGNFDIWRFEVVGSGTK